MRESTRVTVVGRAKVMSHDDKVEAQRKRSEKEAGKTQCSKLIQVRSVPIARLLSSVDEEILEAKREIEGMGLTRFCHVLNFNRLAS